MLKFVYISVYDYENSVKTTDTKYPMIEIEIDWKVARPIDHGTNGNI